MTDLKRLRDWHGSEGSEFAKVLADGDKKKLAAVANHAETARILSVLEAVREGCDFGPLRELNEGRPDVACLDFTGPADTLRDLAELLNPSRTNQSGADSDVATGRHFSEARGLFKDSEYSQSNHVGDLDELLGGGK